MGFLIGFGAFMGTFLVYHIIGSSIFPVDENNVLQAPDIYPIIGIALCVCATVFTVREWKKVKEKNSKLPKRKVQMPEIAEKEIPVKNALNENFTAPVKNEYSEVPVAPVENHSPTPVLHDSSGDVIDTTSMSPEEKYAAALSIVYMMGTGSVIALQRRLGLGYSEAARLIDRMEAEGIISPFEGTHPRRVYKKGENIPQKAHAHTPATALAGVDVMEGHDFEDWCADILRRNGFINVEVTPGSGDHGVDVLAEKDGIGYAIQCKCYSKDLGNTPVQEVSAGKVMYERPIGVVMTNRYFTEGAKQLAKKTMTLLWDRDKLQEFIEHANLHI